MNFLDDIAFFSDDDDKNPLVERFEQMLKDGQSVYFGTEEFEEIVEYYLLSMESEKALQALEVAQRRYPKESHFLLLQAVALLEGSRFKEAEAVSRRLGRMEPGSYEAMHIRAVSAIAAGSTAKGLNLLEKTLKIASEDSQKIHILSPAIEFLQRTQHYDEALKYAIQLHQLVPKNEEALLLMARCYKDCNDLATSIKYYREYLSKRQNDNDFLWLELGRVYEQAGQMRESLKVFNKVLRRNPDNVQAYWHKAAFYTVTKNMKAVLRVHDALLARKPDFLPGWYTKGRCYADMNRCEDAMKCYYKVLELDPHYADAYFAMAALMMVNKKPRHQAEYIKRALALDPYNQNYYLCYVNVLMHGKKWSKAEQALEHCLMISSDFTPAWLLLSDLQSRNSYARAIDTLKEAQEYLPDDMRIVCRLAIMYFRNQNMAACWNSVKQLLRTNPAAAIEFLHECPEASINPEFMIILKNAVASAQPK